MASEKGKSSYIQGNKTSIKEEEILVTLSSLSSGVERTEQGVSEVRSAFQRYINGAGKTALVDRSGQFQSILSQVLTSVRNAKAIINNLKGEITAIATPVHPNLANATSVQKNQAAVVSFFHKSQLSTPPDITPKTQAPLLCNRATLLPQSNIIHQQMQTAAVAIVPRNNESSRPPPRGRGRGRGQGQGQRRASPQGLQQVLNPRTNVESPAASEIFTKKRRLEDLYGGNNELPERLKHFDPYLIQRILAEIVDQDAIVKWNDIAGLEHAKNCVYETVLWPILNPRIFQGVRSKSKGILLFGPPGTGKTMIGKAIAGEIKATFFNISASTLSCNRVGEGEMLARALFGVARQFQPSVIFFDEIDCILFSRSSKNEHEAFRRLKTQLLVEMDGIHSGSEQIVVVGATNRPQDIDEAALRRLSKRLYIPLPCPEARLQIICNAMEKVGPYALSKQDLDLICNSTHGYSGSDMKNLVDEAIMGPIRDAVRGVRKGKDIRQLEPEDLRPVALQDFETASLKVRPSVSQQELAAYVEWNAKFGSMSLETQPCMAVSDRRSST